MCLFKPKAIKYKKINVGKAIVLIVFTDNSSEVREIYGHSDAPAKYVAKAFMGEVPRHDYRVYANDKMTFKDVRCVEIVEIKEYFVEVPID